MKLFVVGLGPGGLEQATQRACEVLESADVIAGYTVYVDLIRADFPGKELLSTPMKREEERCRLALEAAQNGKTVAMVCSGDPVVYGMAGLLFELAPAYPGVEVEVIPGVTAACSGGAMLGAPLGHDFAVISLSDLLTPWALIERRLELAAQADFALCLYNPSSKKRVDYLKRACDIVLRHRDGATVCGIAQNIGREGACSRVLTLAELRDTQVDMFTTVWIGSTSTKEVGGKMVTPRGYLNRT